MTLKSDPNFEEKLIYCLKNDMRSSVNFKVSSENSENLRGHICGRRVMFELKK